MFLKKPFQQFHSIDTVDKKKLFNNYCFLKLFLFSDILRLLTIISVNMVSNDIFEKKKKIRSSSNLHLETPKEFVDLKL